MTLDNAKAARAARDLIQRAEELVLAECPLALVVPTLLAEARRGLIEYERNVESLCGEGVTPCRS